ncbi:cyclic nucleotide-binding domain-containing protein [Gammaproteobacteria bacterium]|nr:cyclic nucleotide-binding domain-containing protein [Gammaproteobacteria bacterium]
MEKSEIVSIAQQVIADLELDEIETLVEIMEQRHAEAGTIMLSQGDRSNHLLLLLNGDFSVFSKFRVNLTSVAMNTNNFSGPGLLGEVNLVLQATRTATVVSRSECDYLFLDMDSYNKIVVEHPRIAIKLVTKIASIIQNRGDTMRRIMYQNLIKDSPNPMIGISRIGFWLGKWTRISDDMSRRLFSDFEGENFNS